MSSYEMLGWPETCSSPNFVKSVISLKTEKSQNGPREVF